MNLPAVAGFYPYRPAAWLRVSGPDAPGFLQGQFTNDLKGLAAHQAVYGLWLDHKGKVFADSFVIGSSADGEFSIASYFCPGEAIRQRLEGYIIADDVVVENLTPDWAGLTVIGEGSRSWLPAGTPAEGVIFRGRRGEGENWEWIFPARLRSLDPPSPLAMARQAASDDAAKNLTSAEIEYARISAGIPAVPRDLGPGDLPNEGGLEESAISYTKGCYLGQEVMARLKSRGRLRRQLKRLQGSGPIPSLPAALWQGSQAVGEVRSACAEPSGDNFIGMAMLNLAHFRPETPLAFSAGGPAAAATF